MEKTYLCYVCSFLFHETGRIKKRRETGPSLSLATALGRGIPCGPFSRQSRFSPALLTKLGVYSRVRLAGIRLARIDGQLESILGSRFPAFFVSIRNSVKSTDSWNSSYPNSRINGSRFWVKSTVTWNQGRSQIPSIRPNFCQMASLSF